MTTEIDVLAKYPSTDKFKVVDVVMVPHPYCIGTKHVAWASDKFSGILSGDAIRSAEQHFNAKCYICDQSYDEHKRAILVEVHDDSDLNNNPELKEYLMSIKTMAEADGFAGFCFRHKGGMTR